MASKQPEQALRDANFVRWVRESILYRGYRTTVNALVRAGFSEPVSIAIVQAEHDKILNGAGATDED